MPTNTPSGLQLVVGLGNPGSDYARTRHNAGFWFVDRLAAARQAPFSTERKFFGELARTRSPGADCLLLKPTTFMNASGRALCAVADYYRIEPARILVVHDEIDLPAGVIRLKKSGGHGGHKGLSDVTEKLGDSGYRRLRIGVGHPGDKSGVLAYVLSRPDGNDSALIDQALQAGLEIMPLLFAGELERAMHRLHGRERPMAELPPSPEGGARGEG